MSARNHIPFHSLSTRQQEMFSFSLANEISYDEVLHFVRFNLSPENVFDRGTLMDWAERNKEEILKELEKRRKADDCVY